MQMSEPINDRESDEAATEEAAKQYALTNDQLLRVYSVGPVTVLGFGGIDVPAEFNAAHYRAAIADLVKLNQSSIVAFDLTGACLVPGGLLSLLISLTRIRDLPLRVQLFNPSDSVREVLSIAKLNTMIEIHDIDVQPMNKAAG